MGSITSEYIAFVAYIKHRIYKTSQELQMLPRSLPDCHSSIKTAVSVVIVVIVYWCLPVTLCLAVNHQKCLKSLTIVSTSV